MNKPTRAQLRALIGIAECQIQCDREDGWATMWSVDVSSRTLNACIAKGWLEKSVRSMAEVATRGWPAYRLTDAGRAVCKEGESLCVTSTPKRWQKLQARVAELESALRPFAALYYHGGIRAGMPNNTPMWTSLGDIRRARAVLAKEGDTE